MDAQTTPVPLAPAITPDQAWRAIEAERQARIQACAMAIQAVLNQHGCDLQAVPQITPDGRIVAQVAIVSRER